MKPIHLLVPCVLLAVAAGNEIDFDDDDITDGMFDINDDDDGDIDIYMKHTPTKGVVAPQDVNFTIYARGNCSAPLFLNETPAECFDPGRPTKILIHGFLAKGRTFNNMKDAYLHAGDYNVIIVDWSKVAACWRSSKLSALIKFCYNSIVKKYLDQVSNYVSLMIQKLVTEGQHLGQLHMVGHSLGAHVAGQASEKTRVLQYVGRITGLDPASPLLKSKNLTKVLDKSDAEFVDVIHTNVNYLGWKEPLGTADFYPYDGGKQPGCSFPSRLLQKCSHSKSHKYFTQSILDAWAFVAIPCGVLDEYERDKCNGKDVIHMGESVPLSAKGSYYVVAADSPRTAGVAWWWCLFVVALGLTA